MKPTLALAVATMFCAAPAGSVAAGEEALPEAALTSASPSPNRAGLGLELFELNPEGAAALGLPPDSRGACVTRVLPGGAAEIAGVQTYDLIVALDGRSVARPMDLIQALGPRQPGDRVQLRLIRHRQTLNIEAQLIALRGAGPAGQFDPAGGTISPGRPLPSPPLPQGFEARDDRESSGRLITIKFSHGNPSARAAMREYLSLIQGYFDAPPKLTLAVGDAKDELIQAMFDANLAGEPVRGLVTAVTGEQNGLFALIFDRPAALRGSYPNLQRMLVGEYPASAAASPAAAPDWNRQTTADGSDALLLPADWRVTGGGRGTIEAEGPNGESVSLGLALPVSTVGLGILGPDIHVSPELRAQAEQAMRNVAVSPYLAPIAAQSFAGELVNRFAGGGTPLVEFGRVIDTAPAPSPGGQGLFILRECRLRGRQSVILAYVLTIPTGFQQWMLYDSSVAAPADSFFATLPTLARIWGSWKTDDRVFQDRLQAAMRSMKETNQIARDVNDYRTKVQDHASAVWDHYIRGTDTVENTETGTRHIVDSAVVDDLLRKANEQGVPLRKVPID